MQKNLISPLNASVHPTISQTWQWIVFIKIPRWSSHNQWQWMQHANWHPSRAKGRRVYLRKRRSNNSSLPKICYEAHHVPALRPRNGNLVPCRDRDQAARGRAGAVPLPVLHVPPALERLDGLVVVQAGNVIDRDGALAESPLVPGGLGSISIPVIGWRNCGMDSFRRGANWRSNRGQRGGGGGRRLGEAEVGGEEKGARVEGPTSAGEREEESQDYEEESGG